MDSKNRFFHSDINTSPEDIQKNRKVMLLTVIRNHDDKVIGSKTIEYPKEYEHNMWYEVILN